jgi:hypothetical protein
MFAVQLFKGLCIEVCVFILLAIKMFFSDDIAPICILMVAVIFADKTKWSKSRASSGSLTHPMSAYCDCQRNSLGMKSTTV